MLRWLFVVVVAFVAGVLLNFYAYKRFFKKIYFIQPYLKFIRPIFYLISILELIFILSVLVNFRLSLFVYLAGATLLGFSWFMFCIALIYDILRSNLKRTKFNANRRKFIKICFDLAFLIAFFGYFLRGVFTALRPPKITQRQIKIKNLSRPLRIALISDVHIGEFLQKEFLATLVYQINQTKPDLVAIAGDLVDLNADNIGDFLEPLRDLKSTYGTFYVPGNHEYYHGIDGILEKISEVGVKILGNSCEIVGGVNLCGVYDLAGTKFGYLEPDLNQALKQTESTLPTILLSHQPKFINSMQKSVDLVLCGHTHAGQIFPFQLLVLLDQPYLYGLYKHNDKMQVYVSSGAGFWGPPVRILAPSEIAILDLIGD